MSTYCLQEEEEQTPEKVKVRCGPRREATNDTKKVLVLGSVKNKLTVGGRRWGFSGQEVRTTVKLH